MHQNLYLIPNCNNLRPKWPYTPKKKVIKEKCSKVSADIISVLWSLEGLPRVSRSYSPFVVVVGLCGVHNVNTHIHGAGPAGDEGGVKTIVLRQ